MNRRFFLSLPFIAAGARLVQHVTGALRKRWAGSIVVGKGQEYTTLAGALRDAPERGGTIFVMPGHVETINMALDVSDMALIGLPHTRPTFKGES